MLEPTKKRRLPKRNRNEDLETISSKQLYDVLPIENFEIREIPRRDKGVDTLIELKSSENHLGIEFIVQLKATRKISKKNYHSKVIETSNLEYLLNHSQSPMYILYVEGSKTYYYEWAEDFARRLAEKDSDWDTKPSHTLRFQKVLTIEEAKVIYDQVLRDGEEQRRERDFVIQGDLQSIVNSMHDGVEGTGNILESFQTLFEKFSGLTLLPVHVIERLPPFASLVNSATHYSESDSIIRTDNSKLITFFENLKKLKQNKVILNPDEDDSNLTGGVKSKLIREILNFFYRNSIHHLGSLQENGNKRICIHALYVSGSCNCERCLYYRLDFKGALEKVASVKPKSLYELLRNAHTLLEIGDFKNSYLLYKKSIQTFKMDKHFVGYFMCKYNLSRAYRLFRWNYFESDRASVLKDIKQINLDDEIYLLQKKHKLNDEVILVLKWISQGSFINYAHRELDEKLVEIRSVHRNDKLGGWTSAEHSVGLLKLFRQTTDFVEFNLIMYDVLGGYSSFVDKSIDGMLMLYDLKNEHNNPLKGFTSDILLVMLLQGTASRLEESLSKYKVTSLKFDIKEAGAKSTFKLHINNFISSLEFINKAIDINNDSSNHFLNRKANDIIKNLCVLLSVADIHPNELNDIVTALLDKFESCEFIQSSSTSYIIQIINRKVTALSPEVLERIYALSLTSNRMDIDRIKTGMPGLFKKYFPKYDLSPATITSVMGFGNPNSKEDSDVLIYFWQCANLEVKSQIKDKITQSLQSRFEFELYYMAVMEGIIDYMTFWSECLQSIPITEGEKRSEEMFLRKKRTRNRRLNLLVDVAIRNDLSLEDPVFKGLLPDEPFYKWLFNLDTFDYTKFNPMWLLEFHSSESFNEFKKHPQIRKALMPIALENHIPGLVKIYVKHFCGDQNLDAFEL